MQQPSQQHPGDSLATTPCRPEFKAPIPEQARALFPTALLNLLGELGQRYGDRRAQLLAERQARQLEWNAGASPGFDPDTRSIREGSWKVARIPEDLRDRRVEITGPVDRKMIINALNSGARVFMADFEDSSTPTWSNMIDGQVNLYDAVRRTIEFTADNGKHYALGPNPATLIVRPRGWHLDEKHVEVDGRPIPGGIFDAAVYVFNNANSLMAQGSGPYLYLPKLEHWREAELWESVLTDIEKALQLQPGTIKVTVLIETLPAVFQMDEILYALRSRIVGLNCGRWDYIFSYIKCFQAHPDKVLPDRAQVTMTVPFLRAYSQLLIRTCHHRGAFAMGGMAAQIPIRDDAEANAQALDRVRADKEREAGDGHDGTWVAHPGLIGLAMEIFDRHIEGRNQLDRLREDVEVGAAELTAPCQGTITEAGLRGNLEVAIRYMAAWLSGQGCVPIHNLMEDAATAEIARAQVWQWIRHPAGKLEDGRDIDEALVAGFQAETLASIREELGDAVFQAGAYEQANQLLAEVTADDHFVEFLTLPAYRMID
ncbi:malate synthase A [Wenzhouxiangella marina]|uniref:malate synthase n=1 Tax=Wenzhouxiangella marina TaxID=1579979 RepID=A0A0K0XVS5_9GAMM|nr:malate synthase A [Wenzhouxiangella marina]AKS41788.1 malate synthase [Wenzhouxiangella marina]MBB6086450.1 malate synthase [Wenzhouxiangella marina]